MVSRRKFIRSSALGFGGTLLATNLLANIPFSKLAGKKKMGIALVGLGGYASGQLAPALLETNNCYLAGIVTGTPSKAEQYKEKYNIPDENIYNYDNFDEIATNDAIDIVYVVLPNFMHKEYVIRAAKAGKHVISEKPMGMNAEESREMITACQLQGVSLSVGYRLHFDPYHLDLMKFGIEKPKGDIKFINSNFAFNIGNSDQWRLRKAEAGGGPIMDIGIYCIQAARYTMGVEPIAVTAREFSTGNPKFKEVEETVSFQLEFPGGVVASTTTSYSAYINTCRVTAEHGFFQLDPAFNYGGIKGQIGDQILDYGSPNQQALQMDAIAQSIWDGGVDIGVSGEEALKDAKVIDAIYKSIELDGAKIEI